MNICKYMVATGRTVREKEVVEEEGQEAEACKCQRGVAGRVRVHGLVDLPPVRQAELNVPRLVRLRRQEVTVAVRVLFGRREKDEI